MRSPATRSGSAAKPCWGRDEPAQRSAEHGPRGRRRAAVRTAFRRPPRPHRARARTADRPRQRRRVRQRHRAAFRQRRAPDLPVRAHLPDHDVAGHIVRFPLRGNGFGAYREPHHRAPPDHRQRCAGRGRARGEPARAPQGSTGRPGHQHQDRQRSCLGADHHLPAPTAHQPVRCAAAGAAQTAEAAATQRGTHLHRRPDPLVRLHRR